jgi:hypothetical protein
VLCLQRERQVADESTKGNTVCVFGSELVLLVACKMMKHGIWLCAHPSLDFRQRNLDI